MPALSGTENVFLTDDIIVSEALRLLENELIATRFVNRSQERYFGKIGDTVSIKKPFRTKSAEGRTLVIQPMVDQTIPFKIDRQRHVGLQFTLNDRTLSIQDFSERYLRSGISELAHQVDLSILEEAVSSAFNSVGTPGQGTTFNTIIDARAQMTMMGVPSDGMVKMLLNPLDAAAHRKAIISSGNVDTMSKAAIEDAFLGRVSSIDLFETAQMPVHTVGNYGGTPLIAGANQTGASLNTDGWTVSATGLLKKGDTFTIAGVFAVNPANRRSTGSLQSFLVTGNVASSGTGTATIPISPSINDGTLTTLDVEGNAISLSAYQNVSARPADNAAITVLGTANATYRQNVAFHRDAMSLAMIDINLPQSAVVANRKRHAKSGLSMTMTAAYNITDYMETYRLDVLWGVHNIYPELAMRIFGTAA